MLAFSWDSSLYHWTSFRALNVHFHFLLKIPIEFCLWHRSFCRKPQVTWLLKNSDLGLAPFSSQWHGTDVETTLRHNEITPVTSPLLAAPVLCFKGLQPWFLILKHVHSPHKVELAWKINPGSLPSHPPTLSTLHTLSLGDLLSDGIGHCPAECHRRHRRGTSSHPWNQVLFEVVAGGR